jgi:hypothetical protein
MAYIGDDNKRRYYLSIENCRPGPEDSPRTLFIVRGETAAEVLENIMENTRISFAMHQESFKRHAHIFLQRWGSLGRHELKGNEPIPEGTENIYLYFRPERQPDHVENP